MANTQGVDIPITHKVFVKKENAITSVKPTTNTKIKKENCWLLKSSLDKFYSLWLDLTNSEEINIAENTIHLLSQRPLNFKQLQSMWM
jgi:hypothetical protein